MSRKTHLLSCCFATSKTFQSFHYAKFNIHTYECTCMYILTYKHTHTYINQCVCVFSSVETLGMFQYIHDITL